MRGALAVLAVLRTGVLVVVLPTTSDWLQLVVTTIADEAAENTVEHQVAVAVVGFEVVEDVQYYSTY